MIISPYEIALYYIENIMNLDFYSPENKDGELSKAQIEEIESAGIGGAAMVKSLEKMVKSLSGSPNLDDIKWTANFKSIAVMNITPIIVENIDEVLSNGSHIVWLASFAKTVDPIHALNYGHTMSWGTAKKKGLGTRPGCKCSFEVVNNANIKKLEKQLTFEGTNIVEKTQ